MALPIQPVTLSVDQLKELNEKLSGLRHDVNNKISLIVAAVELVRRRPEDIERWLNSIAQQPKQISEIIAQFSLEVESVLGITRP